MHTTIKGLCLTQIILKFGGLWKGVPRYNRVLHKPCADLSPAEQEASANKCWKLEMPKFLDLKMLKDAKFRKVEIICPYKQS